MEPNGLASEEFLASKLPHQADAKHEGYGVCEEGSAAVREGQELSLPDDTRQAIDGKNGPARNGTAELFSSDSARRHEGDRSEGSGGQSGGGQCSYLLFNYAQPEGAPLVLGLRMDENKIDTAELCDDAVMLPNFPAEGTHDAQVAPLKYAGTYMSFPVERKGLFPAVPGSPLNFFQASKVDVAGSAVMTASWEQLHSPHVISGHGTRPSSSDGTSLGGGNSIEERAFVDSFCDEPIKSDYLNMGKDQSLSCPWFGNTGTKNEPAGVSDANNEYSSLRTKGRTRDGEKRTSDALSQKVKGQLEESSLSRVLSDPITGAFMDDAVVAKCGHSFGGGSLHRVLESHICVTCGAGICPKTLVPNFALRAAILAYKHEDRIWQLSAMKGTIRRREEFKMHNVSKRKGTNSDPAESAENTYLDLRPKGAQFPYAINDKVIIKGNKRTPERLFGMEAVITSQCLNGWYLVRTVDTCESVRLQYRSLQKLGESAHEHSSERESNGTLKGSVVAVDGEPCHIQHSSKPTNCCQEGGRNTNDSRIGDRLFKRTDYIHEQVVDSKETRAFNAVSKRNDAKVVKSLDTFHVRCGDRQLLPTGASHDMRATVWDWANRSNSDVPSLQTGQGLPNAASMNGGALDVGTLSAVVDSPANGSDSHQTRSQRSALHFKAFAASGGYLHSSDPYRKVYTSPKQRVEEDSAIMVIPDHLPADGHSLLKGTIGNRTGLKKTSLNASEVSSLGAGKLRRGLKLEGANEILQIMRKDMLKLEKQIPRNYLLESWRVRRVKWYKQVQASHTVSELGAEVRDFRYSLLLTTAGGMSDEEWDMRTAQIVESEDVELLVSLWGRLYGDVYKWLECRPKPPYYKDFQPKDFSTAEDITIWQNQDPEGTVGKMSSVHMTTAATLAAVGAVAEGQKDLNSNIKALLASTTKLLQQQSRSELAAVRKALQWEKRHLTSKLAHLDLQFANLRGTVAQSESHNNSVHPRGLLGSSQSAQCTSANQISQHIASGTPLYFRQGYEAEDHDIDTVLPAQAADGEATDMSDSD